MEPRSLTLTELKPLVDPDEYNKGAEVYDDGDGISDLSRCETRLFASASGSGQSSYRVDVNLGPAGATADLKARCSCFAARTRPFCKHAVAVLLAWAREPSSFVVVDAPPASAIPGTAKLKKPKPTLEVKKTAVDGDALMLAGAARLEELVKELAAAGIAVGREDDGARVAGIKALAESLREHRLRRLSARTQELATLVEKAGRGDVDAVVFADLLADLLLCARRIAKHLRPVEAGGEPLAPRYVEELVGKTWTKKDRAAVDGLDLLEVAYSSRRTADDFRVVESRFVDVRTGQHYSEKQILPGFLASRTAPKKSYAGQLLTGAGGSIYPSFAPLRVDLEVPGASAVVDDAALRRLLATCLPGLDDAIALLQEQRRDPFAPDLVPVAVRVECLLATGARVQLVDDRDQALFLPPERSLLDRLGLGLRGVKLRAAIGDLGIDGALPTLWPIALVVERPLPGGQGAGLELVGVGGDASDERRRQRERKPEAWTQTARRAQIPQAAVVLGEVREELARLLVTGLHALSSHAVEPAAVRLDELGLQKPAELLRTTSKKDDPLLRLDDVVKLHHVTGVALVRLAAASAVERASLCAVPTFDSVRVRRRRERLNPREVATLTAQGELNRYEAAVEYAAFYDAVSPEELAAHIYPTWADGSAQPFVARAFADKGERAIDAAERVLELPVAGQNKPAWMRSPARVARITALRVLEAVCLHAENPRARALLNRAATALDDGGLRAHARRILRSLGHTAIASPLVARGPSLDELREVLVSGRSDSDRQRAAEALAERGDLDAIPSLRAVLEDTDAAVADACALALARLGDVESFDVFVGLLSQRSDRPSHGRVGVQALGALGDIRGVHDLVEAWAAGFEPQLVAAAIQGIGTAALETFVAYLDANAEMGRRVSAKAVLRALPNDEVGALMQARLTAMQGDPRFVDRAATLLPLVEYCQPIAIACAARIRELQPDLATLTDDRAVFLSQRCALLLDEPAPKATPKRRR